MCTGEVATAPDPTFNGLWTDLDALLSKFSGTPEEVKRNVAAAFAAHPNLSAMLGSFQGAAQSASTTGLRILFVGINPGLWSGATGHHFARPGNRFWKAIHLAGLTPTVLSPDQQQELLTHGLGVTNLVARTTAQDGDRAILIQREESSEHPEVLQPPSSFESEPLAMLQPSAPREQAIPSSRASRVLDPEAIELLMKQGQQLIAAGDVATARTVLQRAADAGDADAAMALGGTYDPNVLARLGVVRVSAEAEKARSWYQKAETLGSPDARRRLDLLANH